MEQVGKSGLPANAYSELKPGEVYTPIVTAGEFIPEVTLRSVFWGILFGVIFSAGTTFLTLKIAQGMEAAIDIRKLPVFRCPLIAGFGCPITR